MPTSQYQIPLYGSDSTRILGWCTEAVQEGRAWLETQTPSKGWQSALDILSGASTVPAGPSDSSSTQYNKAKRIARETVASLANFRHEGEFKTAWNNERYNQAAMLTKLDRGWYQACRVADVHRAAIQYAVGLGTAYLYETWDPQFHSPTRGDIRVQALAPADVTFVQLPKDHDIQRAYGVIIREELPINLAKQMYGRQNAAFAASLVPDRQEPGWLAKGLDKVQQFLSPALRVAGRTGPDHDAGAFPTVDIFHLYTLDGSINEGFEPVQMGTHGTNWAYSVPTVGSAVVIPDQINQQTGLPFTRPATREDCRLFPLRRYTIFSSSGVCYDGSSPWWHGQVPVARLSYNDWAWEALGSSMIAELLPMQGGIEATMRGIEDSIAARLDPPYLYDDTAVARSWAQTFNPRKAGSRAAAPLLQAGAGLIQFPVPPEVYNVPQWITEYIAAQEARMDYVSGVQDLVAIAKAKQLPSADTLEKLMEMAGPIVQDMVRAIERPLQQLGEWRKAYYFQFYTRGRMITTVGPDGVSVDEQYTPDLLVPYANAAPPMDQIAQAGYTAARRASIEEFKYLVTESGINEIHRMSTKLLYLQLSKAGLPISWWTLAQVCQVPNFGPPPEGTNNEMERWVAQQNMQADLQVELAQRLQMQTGSPGMPAGPGGPGMPQGVPPPMQPGAGGGQDGAGRPASFSAPPQMKQKDGGTRTTVTTSK